KLFGEEGEFDFTALDKLIPHPVYGRNHWVSVLNPGDSTFEAIKPLLHEAHAIAMRRGERRKTAAEGDAQAWGVPAGERTSALKADASSRSPCLRSIDRELFASRPPLNSPAG